MSFRRGGLAEKSVKRYRASLSSFFAWAVRERMVQHNLVTPTRVPKASEVATEMQSFSEADLEALVADTALPAIRRA